MFWTENYYIVLNILMRLFAAVIFLGGGSTEWLEDFSIS